MKLGIAKKPNGTPQKCVNCGGAQPANFTEYLSHHHHRHQQQQQQQLSLLHQRQSRVKNPTTTAFQFKQAHFPALKPLASAPRPLTTWTQTASQPPTAADLQSVSSMLDTVKFFLSVFNIQNLCDMLSPLVLRFQKASDPLSRIILVLACFSSSV